MVKYSFDHHLCQVVGYWYGIMKLVHCPGVGANDPTIRALTVYDEKSATSGLALTVLLEDVSILQDVSLDFWIIILDRIFFKGHQRRRFSCIAGKEFNHPPSCHQRVLLSVRH